MIHVALLLVLAAAQQPRSPAAAAPLPVKVAGSVLRRSGADSVPAGKVVVVLHRIGRTAQGPVDSVASGADGRFRLQFIPDSGALYLLSARFRGIEYFAPPISRDARHPDLDVRLVVYDTSSTAPLTLSSRHLVVSAPEPSGVRTVADLVLLENAGNVTRLAGDSLHPIWRMLLPRRAEAVEMGESDFAPDATVQHGDTLWLSASIPPGKREFTLTYRLPAGIASFEIPVDHDVATADVLTEEAGVRVKGGLTLGDTVTVVNRHFNRWNGALRSGVPVVLEFPDNARAGGWLLPVLIAIVGVGLVALGVVTRNREVARRALVSPARAPNAMPPSVEALIDRIAALDAAHAGGPGSVPDAEWQEYLRERARLKQEVASLLPR